jgi:hypothetical protein
MFLLQNPLFISVAHKELAIKNNDFNAEELNASF